MSAEPVLPRSARLAAWGAATIDGRASADRAVAVVSGDDEPHAIAGAQALGVPDGAGLVELLDALRVAGATLCVVLPVPGDALGLPGPPEFNAAALDAGECVLAVTPDAAWGLVPEVTVFGSVIEPGALVTWRARPVERPRVTAAGSVGEAERSLRVALAEATQALTALDVASWRPDAAERVTTLRRIGVPAHALPPGTGQRAVGVVGLASRLLAIVDAAREDDGGSVTGMEARARTEALLAVQRDARRALVAAVNEPAAQDRRTAE